jgi:CHASE1-domain containing sensor protein
MTRILDKKLQLAVVLVIASLGIGLSIVASTVVQARNSQDLSEEFEQVASDTTLAIQSDIDAAIEILHSIRALYYASDVVERREFSTFASHLRSRSPGIQALEWIPRVDETERGAFEAAAREEAYPDFQFTERGPEGRLTPAGARPEYFPVYYVEPYRGNEAAAGFDLASDPTRLGALVQSRDGDTEVATARITLVQETAEQFGFLVFLPVYRTNAPVETVGDRRAELTGFVLGVYRFADLLKGSIERYRPLGDGDRWQIRLLDRSAAPSEQQLLEAGPNSGSDQGEQSELSFVQPFDVGGRIWEVSIRSTVSTSKWQAMATLVGGLASTALVLMIFVDARRRTNVVQRLVEERTQEILLVNERLEQDGCRTH